LLVYFKIAPWELYKYPGEVFKSLFIIGFCDKHILATYTKHFR